MESMPSQQCKPTSTVGVETRGQETALSSKRFILIPQPSNDPEDPLNWSTRKKLGIFVTVCLAAFAGQMSPNSNQLTFPLQGLSYNASNKDMLNSVAASLAGWMVGPFIIAPLAAVFGRPSVILWSLVGTFACQVWAANMTAQNDFIPFCISRLICGMFGVMPAILGNGFIVDMFFLHDRGKAFAIFEVLVIFAVVGGGTLGAFIAESRPWQYVFWWTLGPLGAAIVVTILFLHDTTFERTPGVQKSSPLPKSWFANRTATFLPGYRTQPSGKRKEWKRRAALPVKILITPIMLLIGTYVFIALGLPIMQASSLAIYFLPPVAAGGYGLSPLHFAFFTMTAWIGMIAAQIYGYCFNDKIPLWLSRRRGGIWHPEYRLANAILPGILLPIGLAIYAAGLHFHSHIMVLALASFLMWFAALLVLPVCYNYVVECFLHTPVEASIALNTYRISFGLSFMEAFHRAAAAFTSRMQDTPTLVNAASKDRVQKLVADAISSGARVEHGKIDSSSGSQAGVRMAPLLLRDVQNDSAIWNEETFASVAACRVVKTNEEAVKLANHGGYGLSAAIFSEDLRKALALAKQLESGAVHINSMTVHDEPMLPHGGVKNSGWGRFNAKEGLEEFLVTKSVTWRD